MRATIIGLVGLVGLLTSVNLSAAELKLASIFSDHMVLQRDKAVPVWGTGPVGARVTVRFGNQEKSVQVGTDERWMAILDPMPAATASNELRVSATSGTPVVVQDVVVGDVWLASGQSNMEWEMQWKQDSKDDLPNTNHPGLRLIQIPLVPALKPQDSVSATWARCNPESAASFSAVGYYFGLKLHQEVGVPIGIIQSAWGGTRIEPWTSPDGFQAVPALEQFGKDVVAQLPGSAEYAAKNRQYIDSVKQWIQDSSVALEAGNAVGPIPTQPTSLAADPGTPTALYNAMIHPLVPMAIRGAIWYQGESNHTEGFSYVDKTAALLHSWRAAFRDAQLPFYFVQIAPYQYGDEDPEILPQFWMAQQRCLKIPHTGMAVITDIAEIGDIHPANKKEVARRLALWALSQNYGHQEIDPSGPTLATSQVEGQQIRVKFEHATKGLSTRDGKDVSHFEIAGADGLFQPASARIDGATVIVSSPNVPQPKQVRFGWSKLAMPNLTNGDGLPATAFHTHWPVDPDLGENLAAGCSYESSDPNIWGWSTGLTDGKWGNAAPECFATGIGESFPKQVTIDLKESRAVNQIRVGVPNIGSTKTVALSVSADGRQFTEVGSHVFGQGKAERAVVTFPDVATRFVRLTYQDFHEAESGGYSKFFAFTSEVEVYHAK